MRKLASVLFGMMIAPAALSSPILVAEYGVENATNGSGNDIGHGLWTSNSGFDPNQFAIDDGSFFRIFDDAGVITGEMVGSATQASGDMLTAKFNLELSAFAENHDYKKEQGVAYDGSVDSTAIADAFNDDIDFFTVVAGSIQIFDMAEVLQFTYDPVETCNDNNCKYVFQFGNGASAKNATTFGGSVWLDSPNVDGKHWDFNVNFTPVPAPAPLVLLGLGLVLMGARARRTGTLRA